MGHFFVRVISQIVFTISWAFQVQAKIILKTDMVNYFLGLSIRYIIDGKNLWIYEGLLFPSFFTIINLVENKLKSQVQLLSF